MIHQRFTRIQDSIDGKETDHVALRLLFGDISKAFDQATSTVKIAAAEIQQVKIAECHIVR